ncbi:MAG TPA: hypothetical protein VF105_09855 [Gemmatimonadaceae bacterium]
MRSLDTTSFTIICLSAIIACSTERKADRVVADTMMVAAPTARGSIDSCQNWIRDQATYLRNERLADSLTLDRFPAKRVAPDKLSRLDPSSSRSARAFRTHITAALDTTAINFAGAYSIVGVGMTGWGDNHWIIDRRTGRARELPYKGAYLEFSPRSSLLILNPRDSILKALRELSEPLDACAFMGPHRITELRPIYFLWTNDTLRQIAPIALQPPENTFWRDYLGSATGTPIR